MYSITYIICRVEGGDKISVTDFEGGQVFSVPMLRGGKFSVPRNLGIPLPPPPVQINDDRSLKCAPRRSCGSGSALDPGGRTTSPQVTILQVSENM